MLDMRDPGCFGLLSGAPPRAVALILFVVAVCPVRGAATNLLINGGFEAGPEAEPPPAWELMWNPQTRDIRNDASPAPFRTVSGARSGARAARLIKAPDLDFVYAQQYVPVDIGAGACYTFQVWLRSDRPVSGVGLHLYLTPRGQAEGGPYRARSIVDVGTDWSVHQIELDLGAALGLDHAAGYCMRPIVQLHSAGVALDLDDAQLELAPTRVGPDERADMEAMRAHLDALPPSAPAPIGLTGGIVNGPDATLLAFAPDFTVRVSRDGGSTWGAARKLAISDPFDRITGAIAMSDGGLGVWTESWARPMYFWKSGDGGRTWSPRIRIGPKGAPLHGNVMIEVPVDRDEQAARPPLHWSLASHSPAAGHNAAGSRSQLRRAAGGAAGNWAAALRLADTDDWAYAEQWLTVDKPLRKDEEFVLHAVVRSEHPVAWSLYIEAWNSAANSGARGRIRDEAGPEWTDREVRMKVTDAAVGLEKFRILVQTYTPAAELQFDSVRVQRIGADAVEDLTVQNADFEAGPPPGRLVIPVREGHTVHAGLWQGAGATGLVYGRPVTTEGHAHAMEMDITFVYTSTDGGESWRRSEGDIIVWKDDGRGGMWPCDEPNVAALRDGRLLLFVRTTLGRLYQCFSSDGGRRWSYPEPTALPASYSPCCLKRVPDNDYTRRTGRAGDLLCIWNNVSYAEVRRGFRRGRLSAAVSADNGATWAHARTLDTAGLPVVDGFAAVTEPQLTRAAAELGELPVPFGNVHYPDVTFFKDRVLVKYVKSYVKPKLDQGARLQDLPLDWFYEKP